MSKLFALEELGTGTTEVELEAAPEVGEVADVQVEVEAEIAETADSVEAIEEGMGAADQLEQVEEVVADAVENGEGLDPVAAESLRIAVEAICARIGANPKVMYSLYATENFQSASSRKANSKIALEGVGEFLKDLWKKIKGAMQRLWEKVKSFWDKHLSSLGRIKNALESMKTKVSESSGKLKDKAYIEEAPSSLADTVGFNGDISTKSIRTIIATHKKFLDSSETIAQNAKGLNDMAGTKITDPQDAADYLADFIKTGEKSGELVGGITILVTVEKDTEDGNVDIEIERENVDRKDKGGVSLAEKNDVKSLVDEMLKLINDNIKAKDKTVKLQESFNKFSLAVEKAINNSNADEKATKNMRNTMKIAYKINAKVPSLTTEALGLNVKLAKAVLGYSALCLKNYK